jgi:hypothetical protein
LPIAQVSALLYYISILKGEACHANDVYDQDTYMKFTETRVSVV